MKIKSLLFGMFACAALVACTDNEIVENGTTPEQGKVKANLSLVISASSNSPRASSETGDATDPGITGESSVTDAVIILNRLSGGALSTEEFGGHMTNAQLNPTTVAGVTVYQPFFELANSGDYKVLVVLNPTVAIEAIANDVTPNVKSKYERITENAYTYAGTGNIEIATAGQFMMVNKEEVSVNVLSNNYDNPTTADISVERVVSKINFMPTTENNQYTITVNTNEYAIETTVSGWYVDPERGIVHLFGLHRAKNKDDNDAEVWIHDGAGRRAFVDTGREYGGSTTSPKEHEFTLLSAVPTFEYYTTSTPGTQDWTVTLDKYALTNLSKSVYAVRHRASSNWSNIETFGLLNSSFPYMQDPNSIAKNAITDYSNISGSYFYNLLADIEADKQEDPTTAQSVFKALPSSIENDNVAVGERLAYCLENIVSKEQQKPALVTGIIFRGQIGNADGNPLGTIYKCNNKYYTTIDAVIADNGASASYTTYENGYCFYYSKGIMHNEDDAAMEYAIMRNNIYVLSVKSFSSIGSANIDIDPSGEEVNDEYYLQLTANILPWVVRFNEIEF